MYKLTALVALLSVGGAGYLIHQNVKPLLAAELEQQNEAEKNLSTAKSRIKEFDVAKTDSEAKIKVAESDKEKKIAEKETLTPVFDAKVKEAEDANVAREESKKALEDVETRLRDIGGLPVVLAEVSKLESESTGLTAKIAGLKSSATSAIASNAAVEKNIARLRELDTWQKTGTMSGSFSSRVSSVNTEYGFLELPAGDNQQVVRRAKLDVQRGGSLLCTAVVTHVEANRAIAEVIPSTLRTGETVLPGDRLVVSSDSRPRAVATEIIEPKPTVAGSPAKAPAMAPAAAPAAPAAPAAAASDDPFAPSKPAEAPPAEVPGGQ